MLAAAEALEFERAAALRDRIEQMRDAMGKSVDEVELASASAHREPPPQQGRRRPRPAAEAPVNCKVWYNALVSFGWCDDP